MKWKKYWTCDLVGRPVIGEYTVNFGCDVRDIVVKSISQNLSCVRVDLSLAQTCRLTVGVLRSVPCCIALCSPCAPVGWAGLSSS